MPADPRISYPQPPTGSKRKAHEQVDEQGSSRRRTLSLRVKNADPSSDVLQSSTHESAPGPARQSPHALRPRKITGRQQSGQHVSSQTSAQSSKGSRKKPSRKFCSPQSSTYGPANVRRGGVLGALPKGTPWLISRVDGRTSKQKHYEMAFEESY